MSAIRPEVALHFSPYWSLTIIQEPGGGLVPELDPALRCGACAGSRLRGVGSGGCGSVAGGEHWTEVKCEECGAITEYRHEWG